MGKEKISDFIYLIYNNECLITDGQKTIPAPSSSKKKIFCALFAPTQFLISYPLLFPKSEIDPESLDMKIELSLYREAGLNPEKEYCIDYLQFPSEDGALIHIEAFAIEKESFATYIESFRKKHPIIDLVAIPYLFYDALYFDESIESKGTHLFLRLSKQESFFSLYYKGSFVSARPILSLENIALKLNLEIEKALEYLHKYGLDEHSYTKEESLKIKEFRQLLMEIFQRANHSLNLRLNQLRIPPITKIYLDNDFGEIPGLWDFMNSLGYQKSNKELLRLPLESKPLHPYLEARYLFLASKASLLNIPNLTPFPRNPPWYRTYVGYLGIAAALGSFSLIAIGGYEILQIYKDQSEIFYLDQKVKTLKTRVAKKEKIIKKLKKKKQKKQQIAKELQTTLSTWRRVAFLSRSLRESISQRRQLEKDVVQALEMENMKINRFEENESKRIIVDIVVPARERYKIAAFMKELEKRGYRMVDTQMIERKNSDYHSRIEVSR